MHSHWHAFVKPKGFLSLRWWRTAGLIFSACCFLGFWLSFGLVVYTVLALPMLHSAIADAALVAAGLLLTILVPATVAIVVATVSEARRPQEGALPRARRIIRLLEVVGSFLLGPVAIIAWHGVTQVGDAGFETKNNQPIVSGDQVGFCSPPTYLVRDGLPVVELTIRLPRSGFYVVTANGSDAALHTCEGEVDTVLQAGVHVLPITLRGLGGNPRVPEKITWPVTVHQFLVRNMANEQDPGADGWYDSRYSTRGIATIGPPP